MAQNRDLKKKDYALPGGNMCFRSTEVALIILMILATATIYSNTLNSDFILDDMMAIKGSSRVRMTELSIGGLIDATKTHFYASRPLSVMSFAISLHLFGEDVFYYHLINMILHLSCGVLVYFCFKNTLHLINRNRDPNPLFISNETPANIDVKIIWISFFSALLWMVHPVQTQAVNYMVQRMTLMFALFYLLALFLYIKGRQSTINLNKALFYTGCGFSGILSIASKENGATLPFFLFLYEWFFFRSLSRNWLKRKAPILLTVLIICIIAVFYLFGDEIIYNITSKYERRDFTLYQRLLTESRVVVYYLSLLLYPNPSRLNLHHSFSVSHSIITPITTLSSILMILFMISLGIWGIYKKKYLISFGIFWFLGNLAIESTILALELIFEHRVYFPSVMFMILPSYFLFRYVKSEKLVKSILAALLVLCSIGTFQRNEIWQDEEALLYDAVTKAPLNERAQNNYACKLFQKNRYKEAIPHLKKAIEIDPHYIEAYLNMGVALSRLNKVDEAIIYFEKTIELDPSNAKAHQNLGMMHIINKDNEKAILYLQKSIHLDPYLDAAFNNLGTIYLRQDDISHALIYYKKAISINPYSVKARRNIAKLYFQTKQYEEGLKHLVKNVEFNPKSVDAHNELGIALLSTGNIEIAITEFNIALRIDPTSEIAKIYLEKAMKRK